MFGLKGGELLLIFAVLIFLFGATRLPQLGQSLGSAIRNFKKSFSGDDATAGDDKGAASNLSEGQRAAAPTPEKTPTKQS